MVPYAAARREVSRPRAGELKNLQEAITLVVFVPFAVLYMKQPLRLDLLWAALCVCAAVYFVFRHHAGA